jgi:hypothetical protein
VWVGVGLLGRRLLLQCEQRCPDAGVEVFGQCNTNTNTYTYTYTYGNTEANFNAEAAPDCMSAPDSASLREMVIGGQSTLLGNRTQARHYHYGPSIANSMNHDRQSCG